MKKDRNARKDLLDLYLYMDTKWDSYWGEDLSDKVIDKYNSIRERFDRIYGDRMFSPYEWDEYYGLFKLKEGRIGIDPKRMQEKLYRPFTHKQLGLMNQRNTTYFHPRHRDYFDYYVNNFISAINELKNEFNNIYIPIIKRTIDDINKKRKTYTPGDIDLYLEGIYEPDEASMSANLATMRNNWKIDAEINNTYITLLSQFFHNMSSRIEAVSVLMYSKINPKMKKWSRDKLYDNINTKGLSSRELPSFKYHDKLYLIWNFIKHNNMDTYENLKKDYPEVLIDRKYMPGHPAKYYVKLNEKLIIDLLDGVSNYFKEWCELNCDENYLEAQWNYDDYFIKLVSNEIEMIRNPLGLEF